MHPSERLPEFHAMRWCYETLFGLDINISDRQSIKKCVKTIKKNNDWLGALYWNDFAEAHNQNCDRSDNLPTFELNSDKSISH